MHLLLQLILLKIVDEQDIRENKMARFERMINDFGRYGWDEIQSKWDMDEEDVEDFLEELSQAIDDLSDAINNGEANEEYEKWYNTLQNVYKELVGGIR